MGAIIKVEDYSKVANPDLQANRLVLKFKVGFELSATLVGDRERLGGVWERVAVKKRQLYYRSRDNEDGTTGPGFKTYGPSRCPMLMISSGLPGTS
ncbi:unnamed protein product [Nezara viridula]|uniref:Uncharacterized protein n=1 Tax=Nezara viridula TaxID=85310 RepID=A0A9P0H5T0_NEZVI|nr:unnamed protein product [Nezara viridula]